MRISRIYYPDNIQANTCLSLNKQSSHYIATVLRARVDDAIILFDGRGNAFSATLVNVSKHELTVQTGNKIEQDKESPLEIHLAQAISSSDKMRFVIQKAVELGVTSITPIISQRCSIKLKQERKQKRLQHWQSIMISACEQCGRNYLPQLHEPMALPTWITHKHPELRLILSPSSQTPLSAINPPPKAVTILIGPEGGFTEEELKISKMYSFEPVQLGPRILRTETAAIATIATLQTLWGDFVHA